MKFSNPVHFKEFLSYFPEIELPVTITEESRSEFSKVNKMFPKVLVEDVMIPVDGREVDEYTEFEPCMQLPAAKDFYSVIYWKGQLMTYEFILTTFDLKGKLISKRSIAGTRVTDEQIARSVATIDQELIIHVMIGNKHISDNQYDPANSQAMNLEILPTGDIIFSLQE